MHSLGPLHCLGGVATSVVVLCRVQREDQQYILRKLSYHFLLLLYYWKQGSHHWRCCDYKNYITNGQLLDYQGDITDLVEPHLTLAKDFDLLRHELLGRHLCKTIPADTPSGSRRGKVLQTPGFINFNTNSSATRI